MYYQLELATTTPHREPLIWPLHHSYTVSTVFLKNVCKVFLRLSEKFLNARIFWCWAGTREKRKILKLNYIACFIICFFSHLIQYCLRISIVTWTILTILLQTIWYLSWLLCLKQYIDTLTDSKGQILDLICYNGVTPLSCTILDIPLLTISSHSMSSCYYSHLIILLQLHSEIWWTLMYHHVLLLLLTSPAWTTYSPQMIHHYNNGFGNLLDLFDSVNIWTAVYTHTSPWLKTKGHCPEHLPKKSGISLHKDTYYNHILKYGKTVYYASLILSAEGNTHTLFSWPPDTFSSHMYSTCTLQYIYKIPTQKFKVLIKYFLLHVTPLTKYCTMPPPPISSSLSTFLFPIISEIATVIYKSMSSTYKSGRTCLQT